MSVKDYKNILIVRTDRIGDVVLTTPVISALRKHYPNAKISMLVSLSTYELIELHPMLDHVIIDDRDGRHAGPIGFWRLIRDIKKFKFDVAFNFIPKKRTNLLCKMANIPERIGYFNNKHGKLLTTQLNDERHLGIKHEAQYCLDVLKAVGIEESNPTPTLALHDHAIKSVNRWKTQEEVSATDKIIALHPGASSPSKCWPERSFAQLAQELDQLDNVRIVIVGEKDCCNIAKTIRRQCSRALDLTGKLTLSQLAALFKQSAVVISNDSGPVHVAAAVGVPVISLFLRNQPGLNPERWYPLGDKNITLVNKLDEAVMVDAKDNILSGKLDSISVEQVYLAAKSFL